MIEVEDLSLAPHGEVICDRHPQQVAPSVGLEPTSLLFTAAYSMANAVRRSTPNSGTDIMLSVKTGQPMGPNSELESAEVHDRRGTGPRVDGVGVVDEARVPDEIVQEAERQGQIVPGVDAG